MARVRAARCDRRWCTIRSEEHTSELQSRLHLVCRLLLEKKNSLPKQEIASWPVLRSLVAHDGSILLDQPRLSTLPRTTAELPDALRRGSLANVTPEGTHW